MTDRVPKFGPVEKRAVRRAGGKEALEALLPGPKSADALAGVSDDRYLSMMSFRVFSAGLKASMVEKKWPAFEEVFHRFDPARIAAMPPDETDNLMNDSRLIRHGPKMNSVQVNAAAFLDIAREAGGFGAWIGSWPVEDTIGLWAAMGKRFKHIGGNSTPYFLRTAGRDSFVLTEDVIKALIEASIVDRKPTSKKALAATQAAFNEWMADTGRPLCQLSRILALSIG